MDEHEMRCRVMGILAGGSGERFWPLSTPDRPKQLLPFGAGGGTLLADAIAHVAPLVPSERLFILTAERLRTSIVGAGLPVKADNIIGEPEPRGTAASISLFAATAMARWSADPAGADVTVAVITSDHAVGDVGALRSAIETAMAEAERTGALICLGIQPTRPETGFGYIEVGPDGGERSLPVLHFREKPDRETAEEYVASDRFLWNSGMLFCRVDALCQELQAARPSLAAAFLRMRDAIAQRDEAGLRRAFLAQERESIDVALLEHSSNVRVVPGTFAWENLNAWDALPSVLPQDERGNATVGPSVRIDTTGSVIINARQDALPVATVGVEGLIVVVSDTGVLVASKDAAQAVRQVAEQLKRADD